MRRRPLKSAHDGFPRNPQEEQRNPPIRPGEVRQGMRPHQNKVHETVRTESTRRSAAQEVAGNWGASKTTRHLRRVPFPCVEVAHQLPRGTWQPRTSSTPFGMAFGSPSSKQVEAPKRPATSGGSLWPRQNGQRGRDSHPRNGRWAVCRPRAFTQRWRCRMPGAPGQGTRPTAASSPPRPHSQGEPLGSCP